MPHRKHGLPRRPKTQCSRPRRGSPVVFCSGWCRLARITPGALRPASQVGDVGDRVHGWTPRRNSDSTCRGCRRRRERWSTRATPICRRGGRAAGGAPRRGPSRGRARPGRGGRPAGPPRRSGPARCRAAGSRRPPSRRWRGPAGRRSAGPPRHAPRPLAVPAAVHPEVGAQRAAVVEPDEQVLAAGDDLGDSAPVRSRVANCRASGSRPGVSAPPASAVFIRWAASQTVSPSGTAQCPCRRLRCDADSGMTGPPSALRPHVAFPCDCVPPSVPMCRPRRPSR